MRFNSFDKLKAFDVVARSSSFAAAAEVLNLSKGAVSYQVRRLEADLGFEVFVRRPRGVVLTEKGQRLWHASQAAFQDLEREIMRLREADAGRITIGLTTYFASRWLSPRLMNFVTAHPGIALRLQPVLGPIDLDVAHLDMAIRWGKGEWRDVDVERLFHCPAKPMAGAAIARRVAAEGLAAVLPHLTLLHDADDSPAWADWHAAAGLPYRPVRDELVIPDPNVRVQAVIDGQGIALNDALVDDEVAGARLFPISPLALVDYGYFLVYPRGALANASLEAFRDWIVAAAGDERPASS